MSTHSLPPIAHAFSGAAGALIALTSVYPLDIIKTRLQVQAGSSLQDQHEELISTKSNASSPDVSSSSPSSAIARNFDLGGQEHDHKSTYSAFAAILRDEGVTGLYAGLPAALIGTASNNFAYFFYYNWLRDNYTRRLHAKGGHSASTLMELFLGAIAGALTQFTTLPLSVVITRQQTAPAYLRQSLVGTWRAIVKEDGWTGLYKGLKPSLLLVVNPSITYGAFERLKTLLSKSRGASSRQLSSLDVFMLGAISKTLATITTYPYILAKSRLQWKPPPHLKHLRYTSAADVLKKIAKGPGGLAGWYKGMQAQIFKAVLSQALLFLLKDKIDRHIFLVYALIRNTMS